MPSSLLRNFCFIVLVILIGLIIYGHTLNGPFQCDDIGGITENVYIKNFDNIKGLWFYYPNRFINFLSLAFNFYFNRLDTFFYHLVNFIIHIMNTLLVWRIVYNTLQLSQSKEQFKNLTWLLAYFSAMIFLTHPLQTQAVTYIYQRAASMATFFYLLAFYGFIKFRINNKNKIVYVVSVISAFLAMFTKEIAFTLPFVLILYDFIFLKKEKGKDFKSLVPFVTAALTLLSVVFSTSSTFGTVEQVVMENQVILWKHYLLTQFRVVIQYIKLLFVPLNQNLDYDFTISRTLFHLPTLLSLLALVSAIFAALKLYRRNRLLSFSIFWFFITLSVESSFMPIKDVIFEHRLYLPMFGFTLFLPLVIFRLVKERKDLLILAMVVLTFFYSALTYSRNITWTSELALWNDTVKKSPNKARPYYCRAGALTKKGRLQLALDNLNQAIKIKPYYSEAISSRGVIYSMLGERGKALRDFKLAIRMQPEFSLVYYNMGNLFHDEGKKEEALLYYSLALGTNPDFIAALNNRGIIYREEGNYRKALRDFSRIIKIDPKDTMAYFNRATTYRLMGKETLAEKDMLKVKELQR